MANKGIHQFDLNLNAAEASDSVDDHQSKIKRHTRHQIQELEAFFKDDPNPDDRQRRALGHELGLEPQQVKNWFQNKRIQLKTRNGHHENTELRAEKTRLAAENANHKERLKNAACVICGGPLVGRRKMSDTEHQLRAENTLLMEKIARLSAIAAQYLGKPVTNSDNIPHSTAP